MNMLGHVCIFHVFLWVFPFRQGNYIWARLAILLYTRKSNDNYEKKKKEV